MSSKLFTCCFVLFAALAIAACQPKQSPEQVFDSYAADLQSASSVSDVPYSKYLSQRAQQELAESLSLSAQDAVDFDISVTVDAKPAQVTDKQVKVSANNEQMRQFMLRMLKTDGQIPDQATKELRVQDTSAELIFMFEDPMNDGGKATQTVFFVHEGGWKIDRIKREVKFDAGNFFSTESFR